jgi:tRNA dimethylallyltransferase
MEHTALVAIVGPTASGKSDLGIALASRLGGEIINCDSVQVFRGIEIATAKVPFEERQGIPHHLLDLVEPTYEMTAVEWATRARATILQIEAAGKRVFLVGGTGFYLKALTTQFCDTPPVDPQVRGRLQELLRRRGPGPLHRVLQRVDPPLATLYSPRDWSRVLRALEVRFSTGLPLSEWQRRSPVRLTPEAARLHYLVLRPPRELLYQRIDRRVEEMVARGLLDEIEGLLASGVPPTARAFQAHGYKRFVEYLLGQRTLASAIEQMKLDTRHYAKRQWTWWRAQAQTIWLEGFGGEPAVLAAALQAIGEIDARSISLSPASNLPPS